MLIYIGYAVAVKSWFLGLIWDVPILVYNLK